MGLVRGRSLGPGHGGASTGELLQAALRVPLSPLDGFKQLVHELGIGAPRGLDLTSWPLAMIEGLSEMRSPFKRAHRS